MSDQSDNSPLLPHGGYEKLRSYKVADPEIPEEETELEEVEL